MFGFVDMTIKSHKKDKEHQDAAEVHGLEATFKKNLEKNAIWYYYKVIWKVEQE